MIREEKFLISRRPYAIDLSSLRGAVHPSPKGPRPSYYDGTVNAVWFRRRTLGYGTDRRTITVACLGTLRDTQADEPTDAAHFLSRHDDSFGDCEGRWDGARYWGAQEPDVAARHLELLRPMLENYPAIPPGYDGWWRF